MRKLLSQIVSLSKVVRTGVRFALRDPSSTLLMLRMAGWVAALTLMLKVLSLPRVMRLLTPRRRSAAPPAQAAVVQARLARVLDLLLATNIWIFTPTCWKRALVLYRYLALNGIETRVVFGVRKGDKGALDGHAWLEANGEPLLEAVAPNYRLTFSFPY